MNTEEKIDQYWRLYLAELPSWLHCEHCGVRDFGDSPDLADTLSTLILQGTKTATCSTLWEWEAEGASLPNVGDKTIVVDGRGDPVCIIETKAVEVRPFDTVDAEFAYAEGEGDRSLATWQRQHWDYFLRVLPEIGKQPRADMPLVCERFHVVYP